MQIIMRLFLLSILFITSCTDDRTLDYTEFEITPNLELNLVEIEYPAFAINAVRNSISFPIDIDVFGNDLTNTNIKSVQLNFFVENSINQPQDISLVFYDTSGAETFRIEKTIGAPTASVNPIIERFEEIVDVDSFSKTTQAEMTISQPSSASTGTFRLECVLESTLILEDE